MLILLAGQTLTSNASCTQPEADRFKDVCEDMLRGGYEGLHLENGKEKDLETWVKEKLIGLRWMAGYRNEL
jgi:hypothetical protein